MPNKEEENPQHSSKRPSPSRRSRSSRVSNNLNPNPPPAPPQSQSQSAPSSPQQRSVTSSSSSRRNRHRKTARTHTHTQTRTRTSSTRSTRSTGSTNTTHSHQTNVTDATNASRELFLTYASKVRPNSEGAIMSDWCTIESDPGVFTSLIESFGVQNAQVTELWSLDDDSLKYLLDDYAKVHGLVFLFKWQSSVHGSSSSSSGGGNGGNGNNGGEEKDENGNGGDGNGTGNAGSRKPLGPEEIPEDLFFAKQVTTNACATQAILSILLNAKEHTNTTTDVSDTATAAEISTSTSASDSTGTSAISTDTATLKLGEMLTALKSFTTSFPADLKGEAIGASDEIRSAHNSFARKEAFLMDHESKKRMAGDDDDVFHFIAYVPHSDGNVYELDGLQPGPISVGTYNNDATVNSSSSSSSTPSDESPSSSSNRSTPSDFAWLATARTAIQSRIEKYASSEIKFNLMALTADKRNVVRSKLNALLSAGVVEDDERVQNYNLQLVQEEEQRMQWKQENERRRHNYIPFCMELIRALAMSGTLQDCTRKANEKVQAARLKQRLGG